MKFDRLAWFGTTSYQIEWAGMSVLLLGELSCYFVYSVANSSFLARIPTSPNDFRNVFRVCATIGGTPRHGGEQDPLPKLKQAARQQTALRANHKMWKTTA